MPFSEEQISRLAAIIGDYVPLAILLDMQHGDIPLDLNTWRKQYAADYRTLSRLVVDAYARRSMVPLLGRALYRRFHRDDLVATRFLEFCKDPDSVHIAYQASFALRANLLAGPKLRQFLADTEPRICVVLAPGGVFRKGTGFLVGPNLIVTAYHTLAHYLGPRDPTDPKPNDCWAIFDHLYGDPITTADPQQPDLRRVPFAKEWCVKANKELDYALVRIEDSIGLESYAGNGGRRRHWFSYEAIGNMRVDERIIIPQHPEGYSLQHDFGRFVECDQNGQHIRYTTETFPGSSGAPCFDGDQRLVGMHNSVYQPNEVPILNQAVRFDHISAEINNELSGKFRHVEADAELWSVTPSPQPPRPILGRKPLIDWIASAEAGTPKSGERVFVVESDAPRAGRGFTIEILRAARRESQDIVVELGNERSLQGGRQPLPQLADDALRQVLQQLPFAVRSDPFPARPGIAVPGESKLDKWAADDLPRRFHEILALNRQPTVDIRSVASDSARQIRSILADVRAKAQNEAERAAIAKYFEKVEKHLVDIDTVATSARAEIVDQHRWERIWVALVMTRDTHLSAELIELITGLVTSTLSELTRIRWLFIGKVPERLKALSARRPELLDPTSVGLSDYSRCVQQIALSIGRPLSPEFVNGISITARGPVEASRSKPDPLAYLQDILANTVPAYKELARKQ